MSLHVVHCRTNYEETAAHWQLLEGVLHIMLITSTSNIAHFLSITFLPCGFFLSSSALSFFPRLISAVRDWMSAILSHMVWP